MNKSFVGTFGSILVLFVLIGAGCFSDPVQRPARPGYTVPEQTENASGPSISVSGTAEQNIAVSSTSPEDAEMHALMLGVISGPDANGSSLTPSLVSQYHDVGITSVRNNDYYDDRLDMEQIFSCGGAVYPSWEGCDPQAASSYSWTKSDAQYQSFIDGGFVPFLRIGGEWDNSTGVAHAFKGPQNAAQEDNWIVAANTMIDRYAHWSAKPNAFEYVNIWTEFPGEHFWDRSNEAFVDFWVKTYISIKAENPQLKVGGPGFAAIVSANVAEGNGGIAKALLSKLYLKGEHLDWFGWHMFGTDPTMYAKEAAAYQELLDGVGMYADVPWAGTGFFEKTEVFTDAYGNGTGNGKATEKISVATGLGAAVLTAEWIALQGADIQGAYYYRGNDQGASTKSDTEKTNAAPGLFYYDGRYKPASHTFRLWSRLTNEYGTLVNTNIPVDGTVKDLWVLAAKNSSGGVAVLVTNITSSAKTFSLSAQGKDVLSWTKAMGYVVSDTEDGREGAVLTTSTVSIPAGAVVLITLE